MRFISLLYGTGHRCSWDMKQYVGYVSARRMLGRNSMTSDLQHQQMNDEDVKSFSRGKGGGPGKRRMGS